MIISQVELKNLSSSGKNLILWIASTIYYFDYDLMHTKNRD